MPDDEDIRMLCREMQSLRSRAATVAGEAVLYLHELRQLLAQRSDLLQWSEEVKASMPTLDAAPPRDSPPITTPPRSSPPHLTWPDKGRPQRTPSAGVMRQDLRPRQAERKGKP